MTFTDEVAVTPRGVRDGVAELVAFHVEIRRGIDELLALTGSLEATPEELRLRAQRLAAFFRGPLTAHEQAETELLLPMLDQAGLVDARDVAAGAARAHAHLAELRLPVDFGLEALRTEGRAPDDFSAAVDAFCGLLRRHLVAEEALVYPLARRVLTIQQLAALALRLPPVVCLAALGVPEIAADQS